MSRLRFHDSSHGYYLDGRRISGVTTLLKGLPKEALMYWSARTVAEHVADNPDLVEQLRALGRRSMVGALKEIPWQRRDDAADRGSVVHAITQRVAEGEAVDVPERAAGYVQSAVDWLDAVGAEVLWCERPIYHATHQWGGKPDLVARLTRGEHAGKVALVDWKTADSGVWPETALQVAAYRHAEHMQVDPEADDEPMTPTDLGVAVHLTPSGATAWLLRSDEHAYSRFRHVALVKRLADEMKNARGSWLTEMTETTTTEDVAA